MGCGGFGGVCGHGVKVHCFHCGHEYELPADQAGSRMDCVACGKAFTVHADEGQHQEAATSPARKGPAFKMPPKPQPRKLGRKAQKPELKMPDALQRGREAGAGHFKLRMLEVPVRVGSFQILLMAGLLVLCIIGGASLATRLENAQTMLLGALCAVLAIFVPLVLLWVLGATRAAALRQEHVERLLAEISDKLTPRSPPPPKRPHPPALGDQEKETDRSGGKT